MDIGKYIGLFLLKNQFCYIHGLGNLELLKRPAQYSGKELQPAQYEIVVTAGGSIDDNLANFIATNEQISISKAANALRDFSLQARMDMAAGKDVVIVNLGRFVEEGGKVKFKTDDNFRYTPAGIPTIKNSRQLDEQNARIPQKTAYPAPSKADSLNWSMVILATVLILVVGGGIYGIYHYTRKDKETRETVAPAIIDTVAQAPKPVAPDTTQLHNDTTAAVSPAPAADSLQFYPYKMVIGNYTTMARAEKRQANLKLNGTKVDIMPKDSTNFLVIATISCKTKDTTHIKDSLGRMFGFKGVSILKTP